MSQKKIRQYKLKGRWSAMGEELGRAVAGDIAAFNNRYFSDAFNMMRFGSLENVIQYAKRVGTSLKDYSQNAWEFLAGMAIGANLSMEQVLMQSILPELTHINNKDDWPIPAGGCTACCVKESFTAEQAAIMGQCWDFNIELPDWYAVKLSPPLGQPEILMMGMGAFFLLLRGEQFRAGCDVYGVGTFAERKAARGRTAGGGIHGSPRAAKIIIMRWTCSWRRGGRGR